MANNNSKGIPSRLGRVREGTVLLLTLILLLSSCGQKAFDSKDELMAYLADEENGYTQKKSVNGVDFSITYRPTDMLVSQEGTLKMSKTEIDSLHKKYGQYLYFNLSLSKNSKEVLSSMSNSRTEFGAMVKQLAFHMGDRIHLFNQRKDTVDLLDYIYPRAYGMGGATNIMVIYPRDPKLLESEFFNLTIEDFGLKTGEVSFKIPSEIIVNEPKLNFQL